MRRKQQRFSPNEFRTNHRLGVACHIVCLRHRLVDEITSSTAQRPLLVNGRMSNVILAIFGVLGAAIFGLFVRGSCRRDEIARRKWLEVCRQNDLAVAEFMQTHNRIQNPASVDESWRGN